MHAQLANRALLPAERQFKTLWQDNRARQLEQPCSKEEVADILASVSRKGEAYDTLRLAEMDEHAFIRDDLDTAFVRHLRYMPAIWHTHEFFELLYVREGSCVHTIMDEVVLMQSGDICLLAPGVRHAVSAFSDEDILLNILIRKSTFHQAFYALVGGEDRLSDFFDRVLYHTVEIPFLLFHTGCDTKLFSYIQAACEEFYSERRHRRPMLNAIFSEFFIELLRRHEGHLEVPDVRLDRDKEELVCILRYLQTNYAALTLKELADFFHYSERQMQRILLGATGMTFKENIQKKRMERARSLLADSSLSIAGISEQIGYASPNNFRKIFRRHYQMTPLAYRKQQSGKDREDRQ